MIEFIPTTPPIYQTQLAYELDPLDTTATLAPETLINGNNLNDLVCLAVDIGQPNPEYIIGTLLNNVLTILLRNVDPLNPTVSIGAFPSVHRQGAVVKITDFATIQIMRNILSGIQPLQNPLVSNSPAVNPTDVPNYSQLVAAIISGGVPANLDIMGISEISASPNIVLGNPTITIASPAVITLNAHGLHANDFVQFSTNGVLPTGITAGSTYYVISAGLTSNAFEISAILGGSAINTSGSQSGTHTLTKITPVSVGNQDYRFGPNNFGIATGATNTYAITLKNVPSAYIDGQPFVFQANAVNTGAATLNVNGLGAVAINKNGLSALNANDIAINQIIYVVYDSVNSVFQIINHNTVNANSIIGTIPSSNLPSIAYYQELPSAFRITSLSSNEISSGSNSDGSVIYTLELLDGGGNAQTLSRLVRDSVTGMYYRTHNKTSALNGFTSASIGCIVVVGSFIYVFYINTNILCYRYSAADLTGEQSMTVPTLPATGVTAWTDGTFVYLISASTATTSNKWSVSGSTFTFVSSTTCVSGLAGGSGGYSTTFDGTNIYIFNNTSPATSQIIYKLADPNAVGLTSTTTIITGITNVYSSSPSGAIIIPVGTNALYLGVWSLIFNATAAYTCHIHLFPITKP